MKAMHLRATRIVLAACLFPTLSAAAPQDSLKAKLASDSQLRSVLLQAVDAVIAESNVQQHGYQTVIEDDVRRVTRYLLQTGNRSEVLYLQQHLGNGYAEIIRGALEPAETLADFATRAQAAEPETNPYRHDEDIELIVQQETERGFLEDALKKTELMRIPLLQIRCMGKVALTAYTKGNTTIAEQAVTAAIDAKKSAPPVSFFDRQKMLLELANAWFEGGFGSAAQKARHEAKGLLELDTDEQQYQGFWRDLGQAAARQGDLKMAAEMLGHLSEANDRVSVLADIKQAQTMLASPEQALQIAESLNPGGFKVGVLRKIAQRQIEAGDKAGAAHTLELTSKAAEEDEQFRVFWMADIAWDQIHMGDRASAEATIAEALKDNETHRWGSDQVNGWMMLAEDLASMGEYDRALAVAWKNEDEDSRASALELVAYRETQAGHVDGAIAWGQGVEDAEGRARTFVAIAAALIEQITGKDEDIISQ